MAPFIQTEQAHQTRKHSFDPRFLGIIKSCLVINQNAERGWAFLPSLLSGQYTVAIIGELCVTNMN
jgi:hypothetical protein